jgi:uncharacterized protein with gpF-like domain
MSNRLPAGAGRILPPIHANAGIAADYRRRLEREIDAMQKSYEYWLGVYLRRDPPATLMAEDVSPMAALTRALRGLGRRWQKRFDDMSAKLSRLFVHGATKHATSRVESVLKEAGWQVEFRTSPEIAATMSSAIEENVGLISGLQSQFHEKVSGDVMRAVQAGGDLKTMADRLTGQIVEGGHITRKRAIRIAHDQNSKVVAYVSRERQKESGITRALWMHSSAGKEPRHSHVQFAAGKLLGGPVYDVAEGIPAVDSAGGEISASGSARIWPGTAINCRCTCRPILPGFASVSVTPEKLYQRALARARPGT